MTMERQNSKRSKNSIRPRSHGQKLRKKKINPNPGMNYDVRDDASRASRKDTCPKIAPKKPKRIKMLE